MKVADLPYIARELSGQHIPVKKFQGYHLILDEKKEAQVILRIEDEENKASLDYLVRTTVAGSEVFFQTEIRASIESIGRTDKTGFLGIAPLMMFLRYSGAEQCWHSVGDYANLTIDDPWLTEPYGHLSYKELLEEMKKVNFHTTISLIPWNYDRSKPDVVSLFQENPDKFSVCIQGNNHDHYEFYRYKTKPGEPWPAKPLHVQEANIKQAIARMEKFSALTELTHERVMVFPHGIAPTKTLGLLKKYNFLGTVNGGYRGNVPLGAHEPTNPLYYLRPTTLEFQNFPSLIRYSPKEISQFHIAIDLFLDNPILLYEHHDFFENTLEAFNKTAKAVHDIQPNVLWHSLGYILRHLYLKKLRDDGNYDILAFTSDFLIENTHERDVTFFVQKEESFVPPIKQLTVDGQPYPYDRQGNHLILKITIPPRASRQVVIEYENELNIAAIDISKNQWRVNLLRRLSDFRDMILSRNMLGHSFIHFYYGTGLFKFGTIGLVVLGIFSTAIVFSGIFYLRMRSKKN
jgi:hypothetical protein